MKKVAAFSLEIVVSVIDGVIYRIKQHENMRLVRM